MGRNIGQRAVTTIAQNAESEIKQGLSDFLTKLSTLGTGN
jgi:hypothetical protein